MKNILLVTLILLFETSFTQTFNVETIVQSGSNESRINLVILSDGYQTNELSQFITDATAFSNYLFSRSPYKEYKNYFNIHAIKVPSNQSGANHPGTASDVSEPVHPVLSVDNYFGSRFDAYGIHRLLVANSSTISTVLANNFPSYDLVLVLVNSPHYGGSGGQFAVSSTNGNANKIALHEIGHAFVRLKDEYYAGDVYANEGINMTQTTNPLTVRWKNWIGQNNIGIYQHCCGGDSANWYRPHQNCMMRSLNASFCSVCIEATIEKIHTITSPITSHVPLNTGSIDIASGMSFTVDLIEPIPNSLDVEWKLNGTVINNGNSTVTISSNDLTVGNNSLQVTITDATSYLQVNNHENIHVNSILWNINSSTLSIDDIIKNSLNIELVPNPTQNTLSIKLTNKENYLLEISDISGKKLITKNVTQHVTPIQIDLSKLSSGTYIAKFNFKNGLIITRKIIKN